MCIRDRPVRGRARTGPAHPGGPQRVGFDDLPVARWVGPPLTTVRQPLTEMAEAAAKLVLDLAKEDGDRAATRVELATSLVVRSSTSVPPAM